MNRFDVLALLPSQSSGEIRRNRIIPSMDDRCRLVLIHLPSFMFVVASMPEASEVIAITISVRSRNAGQPTQQKSQAAAETINACASQRRQCLDHSCIGGPFNEEVRNRLVRCTVLYSTSDSRTAHMAVCPQQILTPSPPSLVCFPPSSLQSKCWVHHAGTGARPTLVACLTELGKMKLPRFRFCPIMWGSTDVPARPGLGPANLRSHKYLMVSSLSYIRPSSPSFTSLSSSPSHNVAVTLARHSSRSSRLEAMVQRLGRWCSRYLSWSRRGHHLWCP